MEIPLAGSRDVFVCKLLVIPTDPQLQCEGGVGGIFVHLLNVLRILPFDADQITKLIDDWHIYLAFNGQCHVLLQLD